MIWTLMRINALRLLHNRVELLLTFVVPIAFFSIFAVIFGGGLGSGTTPKVKVVAVDEVDSITSRAVIDSLHESAGLRFMQEQSEPGITRAEGEQMVRSGSITMAIVLTSVDGQLRTELFADASNQVAGQVVSALVARAMMLATAKPPSLFPDDGVQQVSAVLETSPSQPHIQIIDVIGAGKANPVVSMYAAGIAVMFLLFGATGGGGVLLEERESQTLDRLLSTQLSMDQLLIGKWFYLTLLGCLQVSVMFLWGQLVFGIDLLGHFDGFVMMTVVTASAAAAFGLFLATLCKTRGQLNGLSVILILTMSALGGSMVPRYVMSQQMREAGMWTFNAWALDGYDKVFWRDLPVSELTPQLSVLLLSGVGFLLVARLLAVRWEHD
jgi:ABC-2 type transport system permease protein